MCCVIAPSKFQKYTVLLIVVIWRGVNKSTVKTLFLYKKRKKKSKANNVIELVLDLWVYHGIDMITQRSARNYGHSCPQSNLCSTFILNIPNDVLLAFTDLLFPSLEPQLSSLPRYNLNECLCPLYTIHISFGTAIGL